MGGSSSKERSKSRCTCDEPDDEPTSYDSDDSQQVSSRNFDKAETGENSRSIASSISGDTRRDEEYNDGGSEDERDNNGGYGSTNYWQQHEHLTLSFDHTLTIESPSSPMNHHIPDHVFPPYPFFSFACNSNEDGLHSDTSRTPHLGWMDVFWQPESIPSSAVEQYWSHQDLGNITNHPICDVCNQLIPIDSRGHPQLVEVPIWEQKHCKTHLHDGTAKCFTCERFEPLGTKFSSEKDGRNSCADCKASEITNWDECEPLFREIEKFYECLDMKVYQAIITVNLMDKNQIKEKYPRSVNLVGCTTFFEDHDVNTVVQTPRFGPDNIVIGVNTEPFKLVSYRGVKEIDLLSGCPRLCTGQVLTHEMMHAWLTVKGYRRIHKARGFLGQIDGGMINEGFCEVMAHMWLSAQLQSMLRGEYGSSPQLNFEKKLARYLMHKMEIRKGDNYGDGFKLVSGAVLKYGLKGTLDYIRMTGNFPG